MAAQFAFALQIFLCKILPDEWIKSCNRILALLNLMTALSGPDPGFLDRGFRLAEGGSMCAV